MFGLEADVPLAWWLTNAKTGGAGATVHVAGFRSSAPNHRRDPPTAVPVLPPEEDRA